MSTELIDSVAIYADANGSTPLIPANQASLLRRWTTVSGGSTQTVTTGALHDSCLQIEFGGQLSITCTRRSSWSVGFNFYYDGAFSTAGGALWSMQNCTLGNAVTIFKIILNTDGTFSLYSGNGSSLINTSTVALVHNTWNYIEFIATYTGTSNISVQSDLYLNHTHITGGSALSGINIVSLLSNSATSNIHVLGSGVGSAGSRARIQDIYIFNADSPSNFSPLLTDFTISAIHENGDVVKQLTRSAGSDNFSLVNENPEDDDTTYVEKATVDQQDIYDWDDIVSFTGQIPCVQLSICGRKTFEDGRAFKSVVGDSGGIIQSDSFYLSNDYRYYRFNMDNDPGTMIPWTVAGFNAMRFGQRVSI